MHDTCILISSKHSEEIFRRGKKEDCPRTGVEKVTITQKSLLRGQIGMGTGPQRVKRALQILRGGGFSELFPDELGSSALLTLCVAVPLS